MLIKFLLNLTVILLAFSLTGCPDTNTPSKVLDRYVYFNVGELDGALQEQYGLYRYSLLKDSLVRLTNQGCAFTTGISQFGDILYEKDSELEFRHWLLKQDGSSIALPIIRTSDADMEIVHQKPPFTALSSNGRYAAYFMRYQAVGCSDQSITRPILLRFDILNSKIDTVWLHDSLKQFFNDPQAQVFKPVNEEIIISKDGNQIWFVIRGFKMIGSDLEAIGEQLITWKDGVLKSCYPTFTNLLRLRGMNYSTMRLIITVGDTVFNFRTVNNEMNFNALKPESLSNPEQIAKDVDRMVIWTPAGIEIAYPDGGGYVAKVIDFNTIIQGYGAYNTTNTKRLSFSPDGKKIVFALEKTTGNTCDLFIIDRDGKNLKRIMLNMPIGIPVISNEFEVK